MPDRKTRILVVDDERAITTTLAEVFEMHGYETAQAFSGEEAVEIARWFHPDILLSDVVMGAMNGVEAAIKIVRTHPTCKVLFMSGNALYAETPGRRSLVEARAQGFQFEVLQKPVGMSEIVRRISQLRFTEGGEKKDSSRDLGAEQDS